MHVHVWRNKIKRRKMFKRENYNWPVIVLYTSLQMCCWIHGALLLFPSIFSPANEGRCVSVQRSSSCVPKKSQIWINLNKFQRRVWKARYFIPRASYSSLIGSSHWLLVATHDLSQRTTLHEVHVNWCSSYHFKYSLKLALFLEKIFILTKKLSRVFATRKQQSVHVLLPGKELGFLRDRQSQQQNKKKVEKYTVWIVLRSKLG